MGHDFDVDWLKQKLRSHGTIRTFLDICRDLPVEQSQLFVQYSIAATIRQLEKTKPTGEYTLVKRGHIIGIFDDAVKYATGRKTSDQYVNAPDYACEKCGAECGVVNLTETHVFTKCRHCGTECRINLKTQRKE